MSATGKPAELAAVGAASAVTGYQRRLLAAVVASTFFEGFDQAILALVAPYVARDFGLGPEGLGAMLSLIGVGAVVSLLITVQADRYGRRRLLLITVAGYGLCTGLTALAQGPLSFVTWQLLARMFLFAELALAIVVVAEEAPPARRGFAVSLLMAAHVAGGVVAAFTLGPLTGAGYGWRAMYALGLIALPLVFLLRLGIRETTHFAALDRALPAARIAWAPLAIWREPHRRPLVLCILLFGLIGALVSTFPSFYAYFLVNERAFAPGAGVDDVRPRAADGDSGHTTVRLAARPLGTTRRRRHRTAARGHRSPDRVQRRRVHDRDHPGRDDRRVHRDFYPPGPAGLHSRALPDVDPGDRRRLDQQRRRPRAGDHRTGRHRRARRRPRLGRARRVGDGTVRRRGGGARLRGDAGNQGPPAST